MLGSRENGLITPAAMRISAQVHRVPVRDGHTEAVAVSLERSASEDEVAEAFLSFRGAPQELGLPTAPAKPLVLFSQPDRPQPALDLGRENGMAALIGRGRPCALMDWKFTVLGHSTLRGAAAGSVLNAELAVARGWV